jgi:hypothetical protein
LSAAVQISLDVINQFNLSNEEVKDLINSLSMNLEPKVQCPKEMTEMELYKEEVERKLKLKMFAPKRAV